MFPNMQKYMEAKYGNHEEVSVNKEEFIKMMMEQGASQKEAEQRAFISEKLGASCLIGKKKVSIVAPVV